MYLLEMENVVDVVRAEGASMSVFKLFCVCVCVCVSYLVSLSGFGCSVVVMFVYHVSLLCNCVFVLLTSVRMSLLWRALRCLCRGSSCFFF